MNQPSLNDSPDLSLVICTLDESASIAAVLTQTQAALEGVSYEIIVVDDSADDRTAAAVRQKAVADRRIRLVKREGQRGLASACIAGWDVARGKVLGVMDGDGQHDSTLLRQMLDKLNGSGADIVVASRFRPDADLGLPPMRRLLSIAGVHLIHLVIGARTTDPLAGFFMQTREWFSGARRRFSGVGFKILVDVLASNDRAAKVVEVSTCLKARIGGESKLDLRIIVELAAQLVEQRTRGLIPSRFSMFASVGLCGLFVHMAALLALHGSALLAFSQAQFIAIGIAMVGNFTLNNLITFRDKRLKGTGWWHGLASFILACSSGALVSQVVAMLAANAGGNFMLAGVAGVGVSTMWNYWSSSRAAWGVPASPVAAGKGAAVAKQSAGVAIR